MKKNKRYFWEFLTVTGGEAREKRVVSGFSIWLPFDCACVTVSIVEDE